jgi:autotransporter-associated beta strand protein
MNSHRTRIRRICRRRFCVAVVAASAAAMSMPRAASAQTWISPASGTWSNPANWTTLPVSGGNTAITFAPGAGQNFAATDDIPGPFVMSGLFLNGASTGSITVGSGSLSSFRMTGLSSSINFNMPGAVSLAGRIQLNNQLTLNAGAGAGTLVIDAPLSGAGMLISSFSQNPIVLNGAGSFSNGISMSAGRLELGREDALGSATFTMFGGLLAYANYVAPSGSPPNRPVIANPIVSSGQGLNFGGNYGFTLSGTLSNASFVTFTPTNALDSSWALSSAAGSFANLIVNGSATPGVTSTLLLNSSLLQNNATITFNSASSPVLVNVGSSPLTVNDFVNVGTTGAQLGAYSNATVPNVTFGGTISGNGPLTITGNGLASFTGTNTFAGGLMLAGGIASFASDANMGAASSSITLLGGSLVLGPSFGTTNRSIIAGGGESTIYTPGDVTMNGLLSGSFATGFSKAGNGRLILQGSSSFSNQVTVNAGTLVAQGTDGRILAQAGGGSIIVDSGAGLVIDNTSANIQRIGNGTLALRGGNFTFIGNATTNSSVTSTGTLTLGNINNSGEGEVIFRITPGATANAAISFNRITRTFNNGSVMRFVGNALGNNPVNPPASNATNISFTNSGAVTGLLVNGMFPWATVDSGTGVDFATYDSTNGIRRFTAYVPDFSGGATSTASVATIASAAGGATINAIKTTGGIIDLSAGSLTIASGAVLATGPTTFSGGTLVLGTSSLSSATAPEGNFFADSDVYISSKIVTFDGGGQDSGILKAGAGTLTLATTNTYFGPTRILAGTLRQNVANAIPSNSRVDIAPGATYDLGTFNAVIGSLNQSSPFFTVGDYAAGTVNIGTNGLVAGGDNNSTSINLNIVGVGTFTKNGTGTLQIAGNQSFSGTVNINNGMLLLSTHLTQGIGFANAGRINIGTGASSGDCTLAFDFGLRDGFAVPIFTNVPSGRVAALKFISNQNGAPGVTLNSPINIGSAQGLTIDSGAGVTLAGQITGPNPLTTTTSDGVLAGGSDSFSVNITGNNLYTGTTTLGALVTLFGSNTAFGSGTSAIILGSPAGDENPELSSSAGGLTLSRNITVGGSTNGVPNTAYIGSRATTGSTVYSGSINIAASRSRLVLFSESQPVLFSGVISGSGSIQLGRSYGPGMQTTRSSVQLSNQNTHAGGTTLAAGTLTLAANSTSSAGTLVSGPLGTGTFTIGSADTPANYAPTVVAATAGGYTVANSVSIKSNLNVQGALTFNGAAELNAGPRVINVGSLSKLTMNGTISGVSGSALVKEGPGTLVLGATNSYIGPTVAGEGTLTLAATQRLLGALAVAGGATVNMTSGGNKVLVTPSISIDTVNGGRLDLTDNSMIVDYTGSSPIAAIKSLILSARNGGAWNGPGITSSSLPGAFVHSRGLGLAEASGLINATSFAGETLDGTDVLVRYTLAGDANLDGTVDINDLYLLASNWKQSGKYWYQGDFNYDGTVNATDLGALSLNWQQSLPSFTAIVVPEPADIAGIIFLGATLRRRRRRITLTREDLQKPSGSC